LTGQIVFGGFSNFALKCFATLLVVGRSVVDEFFKFLLHTTTAWHRSL
jgi:hypothetical protein